MHARRAGLWTLIPILLFTSVIGLPRPGQAQADPDFGNVDDILNGRRHMLRTDDLVVGYRLGRSLLLTQDSTITTASARSLAADGTWPVVAGARMFDLPSDVAVTLVQDTRNNLLQWSLSRFPASAGDIIASDSVSLPGNTPSSPGPANVLSVAVADVTGDGFDDLVVFLNRQVELTRARTAVVATAVDPEDPSRGLRFGPPLDLSVEGVLPLTATFARVVGIPRVFVAGANFDADVQCLPLLGGLSLESFSIDPATLRLSSEGAFVPMLPEPAHFCLQFADMAAGQFTAGHDQLVVTYGAAGGTVKVLPFDITANGGIAVQGPILDTGLPTGVGQAIIRAGRFDWRGSFDQAALLISNGPGLAGANSLRILTFDQNFNAHSGPAATDPPDTDCANALVVGNFDRRQGPSTASADAARDPNLQLAVPFTDCAGVLEVRIFDVDAANGFQISRHSVFRADTQGSDVLFSTLAAVDLQGRSVRLGRPSKVTLEHHAQPVVITGAPPMHVDFARPADKPEPQVLNVSAIPDGFFARYSVSESESQQSSSQHNTSWQVNLAVTVSLGVGFGNCDRDPECLNNTTTVGTNDTWGGTVKDQTSYGSAETFNAAFSSQFGDYLRYDESRVNLYIYPVIGKRACPTTATCADSDKVPMFMQFSAPDRASHANVLGTSIEWYQPPWEPGNILSYPGNEDQLRAYLPDLQKLSPGEDESFQTDKAPGTESTTWSNTGGTARTVGTSTNFNGSFSNSTTFKLGFALSVKGNLTVSVSGGQAQENLGTSQTTLGASSGIEIAKPGTFPDPSYYSYAYTPILHGQQKPPAVVNDQTVPGDIQTFGFLGVSYLVDPLSTGTGFWIDNYSAHPDVALNHPIRWQVNSTTSNLNDGTCLPVNTTATRLNCATLGTRFPKVRLWDDEFHSLRGFFITSAETPGEGSQLQAATAGDKLTLGVRVHNYSLKPMAPGTTVRVRFYGQEIDSENVPTGASFLIGETALDAIPPFNTDTPDPNWAIARLAAPFDTTPYSGMALLFWVIVWMEDQGGALVKELDNHGLTALPPPGLDDFADAAALEESYSNNVGYYKFPFAVFPRSELDAAPEAAAASIAVRLTGLKASPNRVAPGAPVYLDAYLRTGDRPLLSGATVLFHDGDPRQSGTLFDVERVGYLPARSQRLVRVPFRSSVCGTHQLHVTVGSKTPFEQTAPYQPVEVTGGPCNAGRAVLGGKAENVGEQGSGKVTLTAKFPLGSVLDLRTVSLTAENLLTESGGAGELLRGAGGAGVLPLTFRARPGSKANAALFESAGGAQPSLRIEVKVRDPRTGLVEISLKAERGVIALPQGCPATGGSTVLTTSLTLDDHVQAPARLTWTQPWRCSKSKLVTP